MSQYDDSYLTAKNAGGLPEPAPEQQDGAAPNPLLVAHSLLRGRYLVAIVLALLGGAAGGAAGYFAKKPTYQSTGVIRIKPILPPGTPKGDIRAMPAFEAFVKTQQAFLSSERVITKALESREWQEIVPGLPPEAVIAFRSGLEIEYDQGELIRVSYTHENSELAMRAVKALIASYITLHGNSEYDSGAERLDIWKRLRTQQSNELRVLEAKMAAIAGDDIDPDSLEKNYHQSLQETSVRRSAWNEMERMLASTAGAELPAEAVGGGPAGDPATGAAAGAAKTPATAPVLAPEEIAITDVRMMQLLAEKRDAERALAAVSKRYGKRHTTVLEAEHRLAMAVEDVEHHADLFRRTAAAAAAVPGREGQPVPRNQGELVLQNMRSRVAYLKRLYEESEAYTKILGQKVVSIGHIRRDALLVRQQLADTTAAIQQLELEAGIGGRISAISDGDRPVVPFKDPRKKLAGAGAFGGAALGLGIILGIGFLNRRLDSVEDARLGMHRVDRVLGVLPHVPDNLADAEQAAVAAHCVHHIRTLLQLEPGLPPRRIYALTSPSPGDGKTTLSIALGMSFAASGAKTLLLDCDMIGGGLSSKMDQMIRPKIGRVLRREGLLSDEQLQQALRAAQQTRKPLGEVLVSLGLVSEADVAHATAVQAQSYVGLLDVLGGEPLAECVTGTGRPGLFILPLGSAGAHHAGQLSPVALQRILAEARATFDVVLVDTGPILGSIEAAMVAAQADGVVLAVSRGVPQALVKRSLDRLLEVGAHIVGMVLNRAASREVAHFAFSSGSVRSSSSRRLPSPEGGSHPPEIRLGAVGSAVASTSEQGPR